MGKHADADSDSTILDSLDLMGSWTKYVSNFSKTSNFSPSYLYLHKLRERMSHTCVCMEDPGVGEDMFWRYSSH